MVTEPSVTVPPEIARLPSAVEAPTAPRLTLPAPASIASPCLPAKLPSTVPPKLIIAPLGAKPPPVASIRVSVAVEASTPPSTTFELKLIGPPSEASVLSAAIVVAPM